MTTVKRVLANTRAPEIPSEVAHRYDDKYALAEQLTNTTVASIANALEAIGCTAANFATMQKWVAGGHEVTLRFAAHDKVAFNREAKRTIEGPKVTTTTTKDGSYFSSTKSKSTTVSTEVTEYFWDYTVRYKLQAFKGAAPDESSITTMDRSGSFEIMTKIKQAPATSTGGGGKNAITNKFTALPELSVSLTWFLKLISSELQIAFKIDRKSERCRTPRRNPEIEALFDSAARFKQWAHNVTQQIRTWQQCGGKAAVVVQSNEIFVPAVPLLEDNDEPPAYSKPEDAHTMAVKIATLHSGESSTVLQLGDVNAFLVEHRRSIDALKKKFSLQHPEEGLHSIHDAMLAAIMVHLQQIASQYTTSIGNIEYMLEQQLYSAIGRDINPQSFYQFMKTHFTKLFNANHQPQQFCYAVRRPNCFPEGTISIEAPAMGDTPAEPIVTIVRKVTSATAMDIKLNAQCTLKLKGDRYLHAYLAQSFAGSESRNFSLVARARQFSSFILMVGKIASATSFQPKHAIIIKDKDDLKIPLLLETLPSAQEFKDAIESLSPEQQRFAKAYRAMQLEGTVFAVAFVQLKPQLERLLNLPAGSLLKEIQLSQDLQELFIDHQIPSDLLTYDGPDNLPKADKISAVKAHVKAITDMIQEAKMAEIKSSTMEHVYANPATVMDKSRNDDFDDEEMEVNDMMMRFSPAPKLAAAAPKRNLKKKGGMSISLKRSRGGAPPGLAMMAQAPPPPPAMAMAFGAAPEAGGAPPPPPPSRQRIESEIVKEVISDTLAEASPKESKEEIDPNDINEMDVDTISCTDDSMLDFTQFPAMLDKRFLEFDNDNSLRPTKIIVLEDWVRQTRAGLLAKPTTEHMSESAQRTQKDKAYDLLDAISRSGTLPIEDCASLHVVVAVTHQFDKSVVNTVVQDNFNPIEKVERSSLIIANALFNEPVEQLVDPHQLSRLTGHCEAIMAPSTNATTV